MVLKRKKNFRDRKVAWGFTEDVLLDGMAGELESSRFSQTSTHPFLVLKDMVKAITYVCKMSLSIFEL